MPEHEGDRDPADARARDARHRELLPTDLQADVHVKPDATSIAYRRWLKELDLSTGTL